MLSCVDFRFQDPISIHMDHLFPHMNPRLEGSKMREVRALAGRRTTAVIPPRKRIGCTRPRSEGYFYCMAISWSNGRCISWIRSGIQRSPWAGFGSQKLSDNVLFYPDLSIINILVDESSIGIRLHHFLNLPSIDLPFDMSYRTLDKFLGRNSAQEHEVFNHKDFHYPFGEKLEKERDPDGRLGRFLVHTWTGEDNISTISKRYAWTYCIERTNQTILNKLRLIKVMIQFVGDVLLKSFRLD